MKKVVIAVASVLALAGCTVTEEPAATPTSKQIQRSQQSFKVHLEAYWRSGSDVAPSITVTLNTKNINGVGSGVTAAGMGEDEAFHGEWNYDLAVASGDLVVVQISGSDLYNIECKLLRDGKAVDAKRGRSECKLRVYT